MHNAPFQLFTAEAKPRAAPTTDDVTLVALRAERTGLSAELSNLQAASATLRRADDAETAAIAAIAEATRAEVGATTEWALGGCKGAQPVSDQDQRLQLALRLSDARAATLAAKISVTDIDQEQRQVSEQLHAVDRQIDQAIMDVLQQEQAVAIAEYRGLAERAQQLGARILGLAAFLGERGRQLTASNDPAGAQYLARVSRLAETKLPEFGCTRIEISIAAGNWAERAAALRSGGT